jgi:hypothetical protein
LGRKLDWLPPAGYGQVSHAKDYRTSLTTIPCHGAKDSGFIGARAAEDPKPPAEPAANRWRADFSHCLILTGAETGSDELKVIASWVHGILPSLPV